MAADSFEGAELWCSKPPSVCLLLVIDLFFLLWSDPDRLHPGAASVTPQHWSVSWRDGSGASSSSLGCGIGPPSAAAAASAAALVGLEGRCYGWQLPGGLDATQIPEPFMEPVGAADMWHILLSAHSSDKIRMAKIRHMLIHNERLIKKVSFTSWWNIDVINNCRFVAVIVAPNDCGSGIRTLQSSQNSQTSHIY